MPVRIRVAHLPAVATAVVLTVLAAGCGSAPASGGRPGDASVGGGPPPALVLSAARQVLAAYAAAINEAYLRRDPVLLSPAEAGTSYRIDAGAFRWTQVSDPANSGYTKMGTIGDRLYVPRSAGWWAAYTPWTSPGKPGSKPFGGYVVFTKAARVWSAVLAPDVPAGVSAPPLAADRQGYATAVTAAAGRGLAAPLAQLPQLIVDALNAHANAGGCLRPGLCPRATAGKVAIPASTVPWDVHDQVFWAHRLPSDASDIDMHSVTIADPVYALRTANGGALAMFSTQATLTLGVPYGYTMHIKIPGYASSAQARSHISLTYLEQFAVFDPPAHHGQPQVVGVSAAPVSAS